MRKQAKKDEPKWEELDDSTKRALLRLGRVLAEIARELVEKEQAASKSLDKDNEKE